MGITYQYRPVDIMRFVSYNSHLIGDIKWEGTRKKVSCAHQTRKATQSLRVKSAELDRVTPVPHTPRKEAPYKWDSVDSYLDDSF